MKITRLYQLAKDGPVEQEGFPTTALAGLLWWRHWAYMAVIGLSMFGALLLESYIGGVTAVIWANALGFFLAHHAMKVGGKYEVTKNY